MADKPVSLAERIAACCPCLLRERQCGASTFGMLSTGCKCWPSPRDPARGGPQDPDCIAKVHALEADAKALQTSNDAWEVMAKLAGKRVEALVEEECRALSKALHQVTVSHQEADARFAALVDMEPPRGPYVSLKQQASLLQSWVEHWEAKRAAALAEMKP